MQEKIRREIKGFEVRIVASVSVRLVHEVEVLQCDDEKHDVFLGTTIKRKELVPEASLACSMSLEYVARCKIAAQEITEGAHKNPKPQSHKLTKPTTKTTLEPHYQSINHEICHCLW
jgi:hypothetical protein